MSRKPQTADPPGKVPQPIWRRWPASFWRAAAAAGLTAMALGLMSWTGPRITAPGFAPMGLLGLALLLSGPPRAIEQRTVRQSVFLYVALAGLIFPAFVALGFASESEAAILTLPYWAAVFGFLVLGWRFRQQDADLPIMTVGAMAVVGLILSYAYDGPSARVWWAASLIWMGGVVVAGGSMRRKLEDSPPLLGAVGWFALAVAALTIQELGNVRTPAAVDEFHAAIIPEDFGAALAAWKLHAIAGWGMGSFTRVMSEFSMRPPGLSPYMTKGALRLLLEVGLVPAVLVGIGVLAGFATTITTRAWDRSRVIALGLAGLWVMATLTVRHAPIRELYVAALILPSAFGRVLPPEEYASEDFIPPTERTSWATALLLIVGIAIAYPAARWGYERQDPRDDPEASSVLPYWTDPLRSRAWHYRTRWQEVEQYTDPAKLLQPIIKEWRSSAPHDEYAHIEALRLAARRPESPWADDAVEHAIARLPWSDTTAAWIVRVRLEQGRPREALQFLGDLRRRRGSLPPILQREVSTILSGQFQEAPADGDRD
ncbi:hypothetical protein KQI84_06875 [bacterium]|nr:hypothetical protein [bacterium]